MKTGRRGKIGPLGQGHTAPKQLSWDSACIQNLVLFSPVLYHSPSSSYPSPRSMKKASLGGVKGFAQGYRVLVTTGNTALLIRSPGSVRPSTPCLTRCSWASKPLPLSSGQGRVPLPLSLFLWPLPAPASTHLSCFPAGNCFHLACLPASIPWKCGSLAASHKASSGNSGDTWGQGGVLWGLSLGNQPWQLLPTPPDSCRAVVPLFQGAPGPRPGLVKTREDPQRPTSFLLLRGCSDQEEGGLVGRREVGVMGPHPADPLLKGYRKGTVAGTQGPGSSGQVSMEPACVLGF